MSQTNRLRKSLLRIPNLGHIGLQADFQGKLKIVAKDNDFKVVVLMVKTRSKYKGTFRQFL